MERWKLNLYILWVSQILSLMSFSFGIPFIPFYIQQLGITDAASLKLHIGLLSMAPAIAMAVMAPVWGMFADRHGKKIMLLRAMLFGSVIITGMGFVVNVSQLLFLRIMQGAFTGTVTAAAALVASGTPAKRISYALGLMTSATFIGSSFGPMIGGVLAEYAGYRISFVIGGILLLLDFLLVFIFVKEIRIHTPDTSGTGSAKDISGNHTAVNHTSENHTVPIDNKKLSFFVNPMMLHMFLVLFFIIFARSVFGPYLPLYVQEMLKGRSGAANLTGLISGIIGLLTALSGFTLGRLGDRYSRYALLKIFIAAGFAVSLILVFTKGIALFIIIYGLFFFVIGSIEPTISSITVSGTPQEMRGKLFGLQALVGGIGWALSPIAGSMVSISYSTHAILLIIPLSLIPCFITLVLNKKHWHAQERN